MKLTIEEVIASVQDELLCYEEGEGLTERWEKEFRQWVERNQGKCKDLAMDKKGLCLKIKDEEEIFEMADAYLDAVAEGSTAQYWKEF